MHATTNQLIEQCNARNIQHFVSRQTLLDLGWDVTFRISRKDSHPSQMISETTMSSNNCHFLKIPRPMLRNTLVLFLKTNTEIYWKCSDTSKCFTFYCLKCISKVMPSNFCGRIGSDIPDHISRIT